MLDGWMNVWVGHLRRKELTPRTGYSHAVQRGLPQAVPALSLSRHCSVFPPRLLENGRAGEDSERRNKHAVSYPKRWHHLS